MSVSEKIKAGLDEAVAYERGDAVSGIVAKELSLTSTNEQNTREMLKAAILQFDGNPKIHRE